MKDIKLEFTENIKEKILYKHGIKADELIDALEYGNPRFFRQEGNIYMLIMRHLRYITLIFDYKKPNIAKVITAYPSSEAQIRRYNKK